VVRLILQLLRIKPSTSKLAGDADTMKKLLEEQKEITELYQELSYAELKGVLENWLNPSTTPVEEGEDSELVEQLEAPKPVAKKEVVGSDGLPWEDEVPAKPAAKVAPKKPAAPKDDVAAAFDDLFNN